MCNFIFIRFYNFIKEIKKGIHIYIVLKNIKSIVFCTFELIQIFLTFSISDASSFKQVNKCGKNILYIYTVQKPKNVGVIFSSHL